MKVYNTSLIKKGILFSLFLLSPEILAAENLNFNYTRSGVLNLEPRLGLQARACHSKGDPMDIRIHLAPIRVGEKFNVTLAVQGAAYTESYAVFSAVSRKDKKLVADTDFLVPWSVDVKGNTKGNYLYWAFTPETLPVWGNNFCFVPDKRNDSSYTKGYAPVFKGTDDYNLCRKKPILFDQRYVWGGNPVTTPMPEQIKSKVDEYGDAYLTGNYQFFTTYTPGKPSYHDVDSSDFNSSENKVSKEENFTYRLPIGSENNMGVRIDGGDFLIKLSNRNISSLTLTITSGNVSDVWSWRVAADDVYKNRLHLNHLSNLGIQALVSDNSDPYFVNHFYKENRYYKGSLAAGAFLTQAYTDYIDSIMPLSLPPSSDGEINLVNTDGLTFTIGQQSSVQGYGSMKFSAYGQPLKFAPLIVNGKEAASAMQVRNACY